nr:MAG TPA: hypothetical protein [Caudoviricetes sp.]
MHRLFFCSDFKSSGLFARSVLESKNGKELRLHYVCKALCVQRGNHNSHALVGLCKDMGLVL